MILELAQLTIRPGDEARFEAAFPAAGRILGAAKGYVSHQLKRSVETPNRYALLVHWQTLEDHIVGFRESPAFKEWRALIGPYFGSPPLVEHFQTIANAA
jgi:heme-degrading monooxygenase HmoA